MKLSELLTELEKYDGDLEVAVQNLNATGKQEDVHIAIEPVKGIDVVYIYSEE